MRILYFYQYFGTSRGSWGTRVYEFAREWVDSGHQVTVVTALFVKSDLQAEKFIERRKLDGIDLIILNIPVDNKQSRLRRIWTFLTYAIVATFFAFREPCDVVVSSSGPLTVAIPGLAAKFARNRKLVFEVRDLWPDTAIQTGYLSNRLIIRLLYLLEKYSYTNADLIVTLSRGIEQSITGRFGTRNIISIPNPANRELFGQNSEGGLPGSLSRRGYAIYTGNIGSVNRSRLLLETAGELRKRGVTDLKIVLVGDGPEKQLLQKEAVEAGLDDHFLIFNLMSKENLVPLVRHALASLVPLADMPVLDTSSPNKLFDSLAAGIPVVQTTGGWIRELLDQHKCGLTVRPANAESMAEALINLQNNPENWNIMSKNAARLAASEFDKSELAHRMLRKIECL